MTTRNNWIAVACAAHARRGCAVPQQGYMQVCHGKAAPLKRVAPGMGFFAHITDLDGNRVGLHALA
ncbi:hypothetical protein [Rhodoferax saidenbachensis]|uniref:Glyoxalase-like domain-containing protein n=1 Tax=Rhodoferax saidenbachensis TaxID=1484693 RepID=A0ABU1ZME4_9BURK|nr:hypothetical protein [Rhodoferax saidenbachensis]MDR7306704.1 hypothetical protein [Rhodoferax saidenbachensis]